MDSLGLVPVALRRWLSERVRLRSWLGVEWARASLQRLVKSWVWYILIDTIPYTIYTNIWIIIHIYIYIYTKTSLYIYTLWSMYIYNIYIYIYIQYTSCTIYYVYTYILYDIYIYICWCLILMTLAGLRLDQLGGCSKNLTGGIRHGS